MSEILDFLHNTYTNQSDKSLNDILASSNVELEYMHDWVQWLFPLLEPSLAVPGSPILSLSDLKMIQHDIGLKSSYWLGVSRVVDFFASTDYWLKYTDHNHKRITRIIRSMKLILGRDDALLFYDFIQDLNLKAGCPVVWANREYWYKEMFAP